MSDRASATAAERLFVALQRLLPTLLLSTLIHHLTHIEARWFKNAIIRLFLRFYAVDLSEAERSDPIAYRHFNAFFTRALRGGARMLPEDATAMASPADGRVSQMGTIDDTRIVQAKGFDYSAADLLGDLTDASVFTGGQFCTIYLAPHNYHRVHMPVDGKLRSWNYIPGPLFSVNDATARLVPNLFARNERVCALFDTDIGPVAMVLVGALFVGGIETVWTGAVTPPHGQSPQRADPASDISLSRGAEMGRFNMGSTVILLTAPGAVSWNPALAHGSIVSCGQSLGTTRRAD